MNYRENALLTALIGILISTTTGLSFANQAAPAKPKMEWIHNPNQPDRKYQIIICDTPALRHKGLHGNPNAAHLGELLIWRHNHKRLIATIQPLPGQHYASPAKTYGPTKSILANGFQDNLNHNHAHQFYEGTANCGILILPDEIPPQSGQYIQTTSKMTPKKNY